MSGFRLRIPAHVFWPGMVVGLLCMSLTAAAVTVAAALSDPSFAVEEDYYTKALAWDEHMAQERRNVELGWSAEAACGEGGALTLRLADGAGAAIEGAEVQARCFHFAHKAGASEFELAAGAKPGEYTAPAGMERVGLWSVALRVRARGEVFTSEQTIEVGGW